MTAFRANVQTTAPLRPTVFFTIMGPSERNPRAVAVLEKLMGFLVDDQLFADAAIEVFDSVASMTTFFEGGVHQSSAAVALFDSQVTGKTFTPTYRGRSGAQAPSWVGEAFWLIKLGSMLDDPSSPLGFNSSRLDNVASQLRAWFGKWYDRRLDELALPWGAIKKGERNPTRIILPAEATEILKRLNSGPDFFSAIADREFARGIPAGTRVSWVRIPGEAATYPRAAMDAHLTAVADFERACAAMAKRPEVAAEIMAGVALDPKIPALRECYLNPRYGDREVTEWSVRRPDMHVSGAKLVASENDEMPGGFTDMVHIDRSYGLHQEAWERCFDRLLAHGPLVFVVSEDWSAGYIDSTRWLVELLQSQGREVYLVTNRDFAHLRVSEDAVYLADRKVGTLWRQFPIFETTGVLADLVLAAQAGKVRMVPEFAHFGNKSWFSEFWQRQKDFQGLMGAESFEILRSLIPESALLLPNKYNETFTLAGRTVRGIRGLYELSTEARAKLVLKITGANPLSARSYGVFVDGAKDHLGWQEWITARERMGEPFIVQARFDTSVERIAVHNLKTGMPEVFNCRVLLRPWVVASELVSSHNCCTPAYTTKVHGMVDMAVQPLVFI